MRIPKGTALTYSTYVGGSGDDAPGSIVLDKAYHDVDQRATPKSRSGTR